MGASDLESKRRSYFRSRPPVTVTVWLCAIIAAGGLFGLRAEQTAFKGVARIVLFEVAPESAGTVARVTVDLYDRVEAGEIVAMMNAEPVAAQLATAEAVLAGLRADLESAQETILRGVGPNRLDWRSDLRRFDFDVERRRLGVVEIEVQVETDEVEKQRLAVQLKRLRPLNEEGLHRAAGTR